MRHRENRFQACPDSWRAALFPGRAARRGPARTCAKSTMFTPSNAFLMAIPFRNWAYDSRLPHLDTSLCSCKKTVPRFDMQYIIGSMFRFTGSDNQKHTSNAANVTVFSAFTNRQRLCGRESNEANFNHGFSEHSGAPGGRATDVFGENPLRLAQFEAGTCS